MSYGILVYDIEADGGPLEWGDIGLATKLHCIAATDHSGQVFIFVGQQAVAQIKEAFPDAEVACFDAFSELISKYQGLVCHNQLWYDLPMLERFLGFKYQLDPSEINGHPIEIIDTLVDSRWLNPDRRLPTGCPTKVANPVTGRNDQVGPHSLMAWTYRTGGEKPIVHDWRDQPIEVYVERCVADAKNNLLVFNALNKEMALWWKVTTDPKYWLNVRTKAKLTVQIETVFSHIIYKQQEHGILFDQQKAEAYVPQLDAWMEKIRAETEPGLPLVAIPKSRRCKFPAKFFKGDGEVSSHGKNFLEKHGAALYQDINTRLNLLDLNGKTFTFPLPEYVETHEPLTLFNASEIKEYLIRDHGWEPVFWNYKKDPNTGKFLRGKDNQLIVTTPCFKDKGTGQMCPNLMEIDHPIAKNIIKFNSLKHRRDSIQSRKNDETGYLNHPRLKYDGRLPATGNPCGAGCFTADTLILTEKGHQYWFNIEIGDKVVTHNNRLRPVIDKFINGYEPVYEVTLSNGIEIKVTGNHPFLTDRGWVRADELNKNDQCQAYPEKERWKQWRDEPVYVSTWGRVKSLRSGKMYKTRNIGEGRQGVDVGLKDGKFRTFRVARLVLETHGNFDASMHCLHRNDLPFDDYISNLYGGDDQANAVDREKYRVLDQTIGKKSKISTKDVEDIVNSLETSKILGKKYGLSDAYIRQIKRGERRSRKTPEAKQFSVIPLYVHSVVQLEPEWTYGLTIAEDESHLTNGIFTHNTRRLTHRVVANIPKADDDVVFGKEMRSLFYVDPEVYYMVGYDASGIEARLEGNEAYQYDQGEYAKLLLEGDIHTDNAAFFTELLHFIALIEKEVKRGKAKGIKYALTYGAQAKKVSVMLGCTVEAAEQILEIYWEKYWAVNKAIGKFTHEWERNEKKRITDITGGPLWIRAKHSILNSRLQNAGTTVMKLSAVLMDRWNRDLIEEGQVAKLLDYHDEAGYEVVKKLVKWRKVQDEEEALSYQNKGWSKVNKINGKLFVANCIVGQRGIDSITEAGRILKIRVPLTGEYQVGRSWAETH